MTTLLAAAVLVAVLSLAQLVVVPLVASARGHSGALWFMVTALWLLVFAYGAAAFGFGAWVFMRAAWYMPPLSDAYIFASCGASLVAWLPTLAAAGLRRPESRHNKRVLTVWDVDNHKVLECRPGHLTNLPQLLKTLKEHVRYRNWPM